MSAKTMGGEVAQTGFDSLRKPSVGLLTTYRRSGEGVDTPVDIRYGDGKIYFTTWSTTGKVKRLNNNPRVMIAPFTKMGMKATGAAVPGIARRMSEEEVAALGGKPTLWGRLWSAIYRWRGLQSVMYEVSPA